jgi:hypothetical protein
MFSFSPSFFFLPLTQLVSHTGIVDAEKPSASSTKPVCPNALFTSRISTDIQVCHHAAVLQQSPPASSESSLSTVMRVDGTLQAKLEEHRGCVARLL